MEIHRSAAPHKDASLFGPWRVGIPETERVAGLRALAALVAVFAGSDDPAVAALRHAEAHVGASDEALAEFDQLPSLRRRHVLATYARLTRPRR